MLSCIFKLARCHQPQIDTAQYMDNKEIKQSMSNSNAIGVWVPTLKMNNKEETVENDCLIVFFSKFQLFHIFL